MHVTFCRALRGFFAFGIVALAAPAVAQTATDRFVSFQEFLQGVRSASTARYVNPATSRIAAATDFAEMRQHILNLYDSAHVTHSFTVGSQYFDCIPLMEQPGVRAQGLTQIAEPPPARPTRAAAGDAEATPQISGYSKDQFGNPVGCQAGTIPMRRVTLEEMSRFRILRDFFRKGPDGAGEFQRAGSAHKYAHASQNVKAFGGESRLNLWSPAVPYGTNAFSLSQQWWVAFAGAAKTTQTVEGGWQHYPDKYGKNLKSVLFIYYTADGYNKTGCYNLDCPKFVQVNNKVLLGGPFANYSSVGGTQREFRLEYSLFQGNWWLFYNNQSVGYYPGTLWANRGLAKGATTIDFGGETVTDATRYPPMGSGQWPSAGADKAAYQRDILYYPTASTAAEATLTASQLSPKCYKINLQNNSGKPSWYSYFYFGGPGGTC